MYNVYTGKWMDSTQLYLVSMNDRLSVIRKWLITLNYTGNR